jgi:hypothetical protein
MVGGDVQYVIMKGLASASYYPNPLLRCFGDVDFLVRPGDLAKADSLLLKLGYQRDGRIGDPSNETGHIEYNRKAGGFSSVCEMHARVNGIPQGSIGNNIAKYLEDIFDTAVDYDEGNGIVRIPDGFHHGLILLIHTANHMIREGVGLRHLCDWLVFANHFSDKEFTDIFEEKLKSIGLWQFAQLLTLCGIKYLGCPRMEWAGEADDGLLDGIICDVCCGGNFGNKEIDRNLQLKYISNTNKRTVDGKGIFWQLCVTLNNRAKTECAFVKKLPLLLPFGYLYIALAHIFRIISGKCHMDTKRTLQNAKWRKGIYKEFKLYVPEEGA